MAANPKKKPNVVLLICDQMRGDCLGISGHPDVKTPYLDSLAAEGTLFSHAYTACPSCIPARAALFTGQSQKTNGRVGYADGVDWNYDHMLPAEIRQHGYHTEAVGKMHVHPPLRRCGFNNLSLHDGYLHYYRKPGIPYAWHQQASDKYLQFLKDRQGQAADIIDSGLECNSWIARPWPYDEMLHPTNWVTRESLDFLQYRDRDQPFFLMSSYVRPHPPFDAPQVYFDRYDYCRLAAPASGDWVEAVPDQRERRRYNSAYGTDDPQLQHQAMAGYYACITHLDHQIGRLLQGLVEQDLLEDTNIIFTSDHGELLFDHGLFRKIQPYQGSVKIPLIVRVGKNLLNGRNQLPVCDQLVELRDIMPTILDAIGALIPQSVEGLSFWPALTGDKSQKRDLLHGEHSGGVFSNHYVVSSTDKYIWFSQSGRQQYFDLTQDPREEHDLMQNPQYSKRIDELRQHLIRELKGREEGYTDGRQLIAGQAPKSCLKHIIKEDGTM